MSSARDRKVLKAVKDKGGTAAEIATRTDMHEEAVLATLKWLLSKKKPMVTADKGGWSITAAGLEFLEKGS